MSDTVSIVMPAFEAAGHIGAAVASVVAQTHPRWRLYIVSDDRQDYEALLHFLETGDVGAGASRARNIALARAETDYVAVLDADDRFKPQKLERAVAALARHPIVTSALDVMDEDFVHLRHVGVGPDRVLGPAEHKFVSISMDSMLLWDRRRCDGRYDTGLSNMTDLELLLQLYRTADRSFHLGTPLHDYVKRTRSMSNGPGVAAGMQRSKRTLLQRLAEGRYPMAAPDGAAGMAAFLEISLKAEGLYEAALAARPGLLFEDHLEALLARARP